MVNVTPTGSRLEWIRQVPVWHKFRLLKLQKRVTSTEMAFQHWSEWAMVSMPLMLAFAGKIPPGDVLPKFQPENTKPGSLSPSSYFMVLQNPVVFGLLVGSLSSQSPLFITKPGRGGQPICETAEFPKPSPSTSAYNVNSSSFGPLQLSSIPLHFISVMPGLMFGFASLQSVEFVTKPLGCEQTFMETAALPKPSPSASAKKAGDTSASPVNVQAFVMSKLVRAATALVSNFLPLAPSERPLGVAGLLLQPTRVAL